MYNEDFSVISIYTKPFVVKAVCRRNLTFPIWEFFFAKCSNFHVPFSCICRLDTVIWLSLLRLYIFFTHCYVVLMCAFRVTSAYLPPFVFPIWLISTLIDVCLYIFFSFLVQSTFTWHVQSLLSEIQVHLPVWLFPSLSGSVSRSYSRSEPCRPFL